MNILLAERKAVQLISKETKFPYRYLGTCPDCKKTFHRMNKPTKKYWCNCQLKKHHEERKNITWERKDGIE